MFVALRLAALVALVLLLTGLLTYSQITDLVADAVDQGARSQD
jgi:hypothetical protein